MGQAFRALPTSCVAEHGRSTMDFFKYGGDKSFYFSPSQRTVIAYRVSIWVIPVVVAVTFHEAAHGFVANILGDDTAGRLGRVSFNPTKHIDLFGTIMLPALLLLARAPFLFGYAKPVPVNFRALHNPRRDMILVAAAGPAMNLLLATLAALALHLLSFFPASVGAWIAENLKNALVLNVVLAVFNLLPLPPLDGGRIVTGVLPKALAARYSQLEPYGFPLLIGLIFVLPVLGTQLGINLDVISRVISRLTNAIVDGILRMTVNV